jgi:hypothetical protein
MSAAAAINGRASSARVRLNLNNVILRVSCLWRVPRLNTVAMRSVAPPPENRQIHRIVFGPVRDRSEEFLNFLSDVAVVVAVP